MDEEHLIREYLRDRSISCPGCRYDLRGLGGSTCPECGAVLALQLVRRGSTPDDPAAEALRLAEYLKDRDAACPSCKHNLRGLEQTSCPRCGLALSVWMLRPPGLERARNARQLLIALAVMTILWMALVVVIGLLKN